MVHAFKYTSFGGPNILKYKDLRETRGGHIFQSSSEIYVPGGPNILKYKDAGGTKFSMTGH